MTYGTYDRREERWKDALHGPEAQCEPASQGVRQNRQEVAEEEWRQEERVRGSKVGWAVREGETREDPLPWKEAETAKQ